ncbi:hypothetical protein [Pseudomonas aeruginosa]|uniref:hypothetical protein n=1 Tax=Pseudomonas aeruginosa TaxID=287 RepID=UPI002096F003|nr:hypothetical protein [Pseudomonas aeruginosa]MCO7645446.1 hypothetical protein [Pseudomonas aeruginosa]MCO7663979.1 hypothetical protein [Pseudomonas aeruginosa]MCO7669934.1 hypothetical protein [Pseudomonas aeruginosa]MCO7675418.1 hypothetical protein [Pseudomonas aeruginosa]MCO7702919.1 hypothetical protein [Pseudomonas aeruginosa]
MNKANECTCPSGDGSLVHPCPAHPAVEQAGGDERAACNLWIAEQQLCQGSDISLFKLERNGALVSLHDLLRDAYQAGQARAALAQPSQSQYEASFEEWLANELEGEDGQPVPAAVCDITLARRAFNHWPKLEQPAKVGGVRFSAGVSSRLVVEAAQRLYEFESTPEQEAERPEVVAYRTIGRHEKHQHPHYALNYYKQNAEDQAAHWRERGCEVSEDELMTVAQHDRIFGALRADRDSWAEQAEQRLADWDEMRKERDAALARVADLEKQVAVAWGAFHFGGERDGKLYTHCETEAQIDAYILDMHRSSDSLTLRKSPLYAAPFAQNQPTVPEGWKLVPVEPTEDVLEAIHNGGYVGDDQELRWFYQSILAAAPAPGGE